MNILVIGGSRFMGAVVVNKLVEAGHRVTVFNRGKASEAVPAGVRHIKGDRNRLKDFKSEFEAFKPEVVLDMMLLNEVQAQELVAVTTGIAGRLVVASSCDVYRNYNQLRRVETGPVAAGRLTEDAPLREILYPYRNMVTDKTDQLYDYDKILVEKALMADGAPPATVLRLPMVYGPNDYQHRLYSYIKRMTDKRPAIILEPGQADWAVTRGFVVNCAGAICEAVLNAKAAGRIYNVGERVALTERGWVERIGAQLGWSGDIVTPPEDKIPEYLQTGMDWAYSLDVDTSRIRAELGYAEEVDSETALKRTIDWELAHPPEKTPDRFDYAAEDRALA